MKTTFVATMLAASLAACAPPRRAQATFNTPPAPARVAASGIALAPLIDARPASARWSHSPGVSSYWGLALIYFAFGSGRVDGIDQPGDARTRVTIDGTSGGIPAQIEAYVRSVVTAATGSPPATAGSADLGDVRRAAAGRADGVTIVPILDQFDDYRMFSEDSITGGSSYQTETHHVTKSGYASGSARTTAFANLRLRLVLLETRGGQVVRQATAYVATSATGDAGLGQTLTDAVEPITAQLAAFVAN